MTATVDTRRGAAAVASSREASAARWRAAFEARAAALPGTGSWLPALRRRALARFAEEGWPSNRLENWRHTSLVFLNDLTFRPADAPSDGVVADLADVVAALRRDQQAEDDGEAVGAARVAGGAAAGSGAAGHWLVFVDGHHVPALSAPGALPGGATLQTFAQLSPAEIERLEPIFGDPADGEVHDALNAAFVTDGAVLRLDRGVVLPGPVHLVFIATTPGASNHPRNLVVAAAGAQATVVEHYVGTTGADAAPTLTNVVTRVLADADARVTHLKLQEETPAAIHLAVIAASQARGSRFDSHSVSLGARLARHDIGTRLDGEASEALLNGLFHVDGRRHVDHHTRIDHAKPRGTSREFYRGILDDSGRGVFTGRIVVAPGALRTDAVQRADSLVLSPGAQTDARPELEIYADDVKCAHGATVGQIDEAALFYLRSRGLDEAYARNVLTYAFAAEALGRIELAPLRRRAAAAIRARLPGGATMEEIS